MENLKITGNFGGFSTNKKGLAKIKFEFYENEFINSTRLLPLLSSALNLIIEVGDKEYEIGQVIVSKYSADKNANAKVDLESLASELTNIDVFSKLESEIITIILEKGQ